ncbi:MAG TPA: TIGR04563 family protein [Polyangia bacterium]|nr:TIGR04563 family protein [Polyangia bacterium]
MPARARRRSKFARVSTGPVRKHSVYFPEYILAEIGAEATRLDRSLSWMVQQAWKMARAEIVAARRQDESAPLEHPVTTFGWSRQTPPEAAVPSRLGGPATTAPPRR